MREFYQGGTRATMLKVYMVQFLAYPHEQDDVLNNTTRSELIFVPSTEDDGKSITCRAENPNVNGLFLETSLKLDVVCEYWTFIIFSQHIYYLYIVNLLMENCLFSHAQTLDIKKF